MPRSLHTGHLSGPVLRTVARLGRERYHISIYSNAYFVFFFGKTKGVSDKVKILIACNLDAIEVMFVTEGVLIVSTDFTDVTNPLHIVGRYTVMLILCNFQNIV